MTVFKVDIIINQPIDIVIEAILNADNITYWTSHLEKFEVVHGKAGEVGSIARLHYSQKGRKYIMEDKLIECEPGKKYVSLVTGDAITAEVETKLHSMAGKTEMSLTWKGQGNNIPLKLVLPLLRGRISRLAKSDLETFRGLVETRGANFNELINPKP